MDHNGPNDLLGRALAIEEYSGRLRGLGQGVTPTSHWSAKRQKKEEKRRKEEEQQQKQREMEASLASLQAEVAQLKAMYRPVSEEVPSPNPNSFRDSCNLASNEVIIVQPYYLFTFPINL